MNSKNFIIPALSKVIDQQGITQEEVVSLAKSRLLSPEPSIQKELDFFPTAYSAIKHYCSDIRLSEADRLDLLWKVWLPLALQIAAKKDQKPSAIIQGILGLQGTGKTTLSTILRLLLNELGYHTVTLSIDDLYKTYADRQQLQKDDPRLVWRGPPGTHDVEIGIELLDQIREGKIPISIPRFDKSAFNGMGDRATPEIIHQPIDILLFEGWFIGVQPVAESVFESPPPPITTEADRQFAKDNNRRLTAYLPLWNRLDGLIILSPVDYRLSQRLRKEAEQKMIAQGKSGMSAAEIDQFVEYFWRSLHPELFITPLIESRRGVDLVIEIDENHLPTKLS
ncbi:glycerate kinase [Halothece sp. PCC 7418]|uniref:glycerate kinase n=1 Tax=Halothece sp. (strain PCC 7418) TaxID=65093 RepID=UPI0002A06CF5|nr:glycerate kinase [Halothece sp. PCC 7418]AFZ43290.1 glycerate kinase [Halothece sp. PCC 7418]